MKLQHDHENMAALLDLMLATNRAADARARAQQALDWLTTREGVIGSGIWLVQSDDLVCLARRNIDLRAVVPTVQQAISASTPMPLTSVYQQDLHLTILPLGIANDHTGALAVITQAPPDLGELLLQQAKKISQPLHAEGAKDVFIQGCHDEPVLHRITRPRRALRPVPDHPPTAVRRAREIASVKVQESTARWLDATAGP